VVSEEITGLIEIVFGMISLLQIPTGTESYLVENSIRLATSITTLLETVEHLILEITSTKEALYRRH
jgi:hypothetical protein